MMADFDVLSSWNVHLRSWRQSNRPFNNARVGWCHVSTTCLVTCNAHAVSRKTTDDLTLQSGAKATDATTQATQTNNYRTSAKAADLVEPQISGTQNPHQARTAVTTSGVHFTRRSCPGMEPKSGGCKAMPCSECASLRSAMNRSACLATSRSLQSFARAQPNHRTLQIDQARSNNNARHGSFQSSP